LAIGGMFREQEANGVKPEERKMFEKAAKASEHKTLSGWIRHTLRQAAVSQGE